MTGSQPKKPSKSSLSAADRLRERIAERLKTAAAKVGEAKTPLSRALRDCRVDALEVQLSEAVSAQVERAAALGAPVPSLALPPQVKSAKQIGKAAEKALLRGQQARAEAEKKSEHRQALKQRLLERRAEAASRRAEQREARARANASAQEQREANRRATEAAKRAERLDDFFGKGSAQALLLAQQARAELKRAVALPVSAPAAPARPRSGLVRLDKTSLTPQIVSGIPLAAPAPAVAPKKGKTEMTESAEARSAAPTVAPIKLENIADNAPALEAFAKEHEPKAWAGYQALLNKWGLTFRSDGSIGAFHDAAPWELKEYGKPLIGTAVGRLIALKTAQYERAETEAKASKAQEREKQNQKEERAAKEKMSEATEQAIQIIQSLPSDWTAKDSLEDAIKKALSHLRLRKPTLAETSEAFERAVERGEAAIRTAGSEKVFDEKPRAAAGEPGYARDGDGEPTYLRVHEGGKKFSVLLPSAYYHWDSRSRQWELNPGVPTLTSNLIGAAIWKFERQVGEKDLAPALRRAVKAWRLAEKAPQSFLVLLQQTYEDSQRGDKTLTRKLGPIVQAIVKGEKPDWTIAIESERVPTTSAPTESEEQAVSPTDVGAIQIFEAKDKSKLVKRPVVKEGKNAYIVADDHNERRKNRFITVLVFKGNPFAAVRSKNMKGYDVLLKYFDWVNGLDESILSPKLMNEIWGRYKAKSLNLGDEQLLKFLQDQYDRIKHGLPPWQSRTDEQDAQLAKGKRLLGDANALLTPNKYHRSDEIRGALKRLREAENLYQQAKIIISKQGPFDGRSFNDRYARKFEEILADYKEIAARHDRNNRSALEGAGAQLRVDAARISKLGIDSESQEQAMTIHETSPKHPQLAPHIGLDHHDLGEILLPSDEGPQFPEKDRYGMVRSHPFELKWDDYKKSQDYLEAGRKELQQAYNDYLNRVQQAAVKEKTAELRDSHRGATEVASFAYNPLINNIWEAASGGELIYLTNQLGKIDLNKVGGMMIHAYRPILNGKDEIRGFAKHQDPRIEKSDVSGGTLNLRIRYVMNGSLVQRELAVRLGEPRTVYVRTPDARGTAGRLHTDLPRKVWEFAGKRLSSTHDAEQIGKEVYDKFGNDIGNAFDKVVSRENDWQRVIKYGVISQTKGPRGKVKYLFPNFGEERTDAERDYITKNASAYDIADFN